MIQREWYLQQIRPFIDKDLIKVIVGIRRSGKSTLLKQLIADIKKRNVKDKQVIYLNFEDYRVREYKDSDALYAYLESQLVRDKKTYVFLDEIQEVEHFEYVVNSLHATQNVDIFITGSNSKMLSGEYATLLTGRYKSFHVFPFSFKELTMVYPHKDSKTLFNEYVQYGGFPILQSLETDDQRRSTLKDLYDSVVIKDIVQRHRVSAVDALDKYISYLMNTVGSSFSAENIKNYFKSQGRVMSVETLYNYISYAKEVLLIYSAKRYDLKGKKLLSTNEKYFVNDHGLRATKFSNQKDIEKILENIVFFELLRRGYDVTVGTTGEKEVDFIASKNQHKAYFQVTYVMPEAQTKTREFASLNAIDDQFPKYVLSLDEFDFSHNGIVHKNLIDFLLES